VVVVDKHYPELCPQGEKAEEWHGLQSVVAEIEAEGTRLWPLLPILA